jgi:hypothetical protein
MFCCFAYLLIAEPIAYYFFSDKYRTAVRLISYNL